METEKSPRKKSPTSLHIDRTLLTQVKHELIERGMSQGQAIEQALRQWLAKGEGEAKLIRKITVHPSSDRDILPSSLPEDWAALLAHALQSRSPLRESSLAAVRSILELLAEENKQDDRGGPES